MAFLTTNYSDLKQKTEFKPLPTGTYELFILSVDQRASKSGAESISLKLMVRPDLSGVQGDQILNAGHERRQIFHNEWKRKATGQFDADNLNRLLQAVGVPEGTQINSFEDFQKVLWNKPIRAKVEIESDTYNGQTTMRNRIKPWNFGPSKYQDVSAVMQDIQARKQAVNNAVNSDPFQGNQTATAPMNNGNLPF